MYVNDLFSSSSQIQEQEEGLLKDIGRRIATGVGKATNPAFAAMAAADAAQQLQDKDYVGAGLSAGSGLAYGIGTKIPAVAVPAFAVGTGLEAVSALRDPEFRKKLANVGKNITGSAEQAFKPSDEYADSPSQKGRGAGRNVLPKEQDEVHENKERIQASPDLINAIKDVESGNNPAAVSPKGAMGTMQVMPGTAKDPGFGVQPAKNQTPQELERVGTDYFNAMLNKYGGDKRLALIAYNMGPGAADEWLAKGANTQRLPRETQGYVPKVLNRYGSADQLTKPVAKPVQAPAKPVQVSAQPVMPGPRTTTADYDWSFTPAKGKGKLNPQWTPPPGPKPTMQPKPDSLDPIIRAKDRPESMDQLIKKLKTKHSSNSEILDFVNRVASNQDALDPETLNYLSKLASDESIAETTSVKESTIMANTNTIADQIYDRLAITHGDLVSLYGHEVFGDAIEEVVLKHKDELAPDIKALAKEVIISLKSRHENDEIKEENKTAEKDKTGTDKEHHNAIIQIQADLDKIKNTLDIKESKIYFNVLGTSDDELKNKFGFKKDNKGWYLKENTNSQTKLDAMRAFSIIQG